MSFVCVTLVRAGAEYIVTPTLTLTQTQTQTQTLTPLPLPAGTFVQAAAEYIIMAGAKPGDGAVIARNGSARCTSRCAAQDVLTMTETPDKWFIVNSNCE